MLVIGIMEAFRRLIDGALSISFSVVAIAVLLMVVACSRYLFSKFIFMVQLSDRSDQPTCSWYMAAISLRRMVAVSDSVSGSLLTFMSLRKFERSLAHAVFPTPRCLHISPLRSRSAELCCCTFCPYFCRHDSECSK